MGKKQKYFLHRTNPTAIKLVMRGVNRRIGRLHAIPLGNGRAYYVPLPKVACSSLKRAIFQTEHRDELVSNALFDDDALHYYFQFNSSCWIDPRRFANKQAFKFTIIRDPIKRFLSGYQNRIVMLKELETSLIARRYLALRGLSIHPTASEFAENLKIYCQSCGVIDHHFRPQSASIKSRDYYTRIYTIDQLSDLVRDLEEETSIKITIGMHNTSKSIVDDLSEKARNHLLEFYRSDYSMFSDFFDAP